jgi:hypothetical protein
MNCDVSDVVAKKEGNCNPQNQKFLFLLLNGVPASLTSLGIKLM